MLGFSYGPAALALIRAGVSAQPAPVPPPIISVAQDGWQATMVAPAELTLAPVSVSRQGFDANGAPMTMIETLLTTKRVRQPYPNQAQLTPSSVALSDYVYSTDTIAGVTNSSAQTSPKPVCNWVMPHRLVVGNTLEAELIAFHRNASGGKQVACVEFIATDGTASVSVKVSAAAVSGRTGDRNAVISYKASLDISGLAAGKITLNAKVYPRIGGAASIADSAADGNAARGFSPRYFLKNAGAKSYVYVKTAANGGNDSTGIVSDNAATAAALPFLTVFAALIALDETIGGTSGVDMGEVRIGNDGGTPFVLDAQFTGLRQKVAAMMITRDPTVPKASARVTFGANGFYPRLGYTLTEPITTGALRFADIAIHRGGNQPFIGGGTPMEIIFDDCTFDNTGSNFTWLQNAHDYHFGTIFTNLAGNGGLNASTGEHRLLRGISLQPGSTSTGVTVEGWCVVGSSIRNPTFPRGFRTFSGGIIAFNTITDPPSAATMLAVAGNEDVTGFAFVQNVVEYISAVGNPILALTPDGASGNLTHMILHNNTTAGSALAGRWNVFYDDGPTRRTTKLQSVVGNIASAIYTKSDVFRGTNEGGADAVDATGNWAFKHGVGCRSNFTQTQSADPVGQGSNQAQDYAGQGANYGTSQSARNEPPFSARACVTVGPGPTYIAGAGGGTYSLQPGSAARTMLADPVLAFGIAGAARAANNDAAGAYGA